VLLAMIEGVGILLTRLTAPPPAPVPMVEMPGPPGPASSSAAPLDASAPIPPPMMEAPPAEAAPAGGWFSWMGGAKKEDKGAGDLGGEDRFAPPPMPEFGGAAEPSFR
jgi:hypothetical protein